MKTFCKSAFPGRVAVFRKIVAGSQVKIGIDRAKMAIDRRKFGIDRPKIAIDRKR